MTPAVFQPTAPLAPQAERDLRRQEAIISAQKLTYDLRFLGLHAEAYTVTQVLTRVRASS